ncbi:MAG TPA: carboxypeptidase regulatory-like domain-containing protein [Candidatus Brocadiia bacterium]|nr:carboxypeptidase regulatory-like domain-containing protein [Candidatus Brocadiia bacterium]
MKFTTLIQLLVIAAALALPLSCKRRQPESVSSSGVAAVSAARAQKRASLAECLARLDQGSQDPSDVVKLYETIDAVEEDGIAAMREECGKLADAQDNSLWVDLALARVLILEGEENREKAEEHVRRALSVNAISPDCYYAQAFIQWRCGDIDDASKSIKTAMQIQPAHVPSIELDMRLKLEQGDLEQAKTLLDKLRTLAEDTEFLKSAEADLESIAREPGRFSIRGKARGPNGELLEGAVVMIRSYGGSNRMRRYSSITREAFAGSDGSFFFNELPAGRYMLTALWGDSVTPAPVYVTLSPDEEPEELDLELGSGSIILGQVVDASTGAAIVGAEIKVIPPANGAGPIRTDATGRFRISGLAAGRYHLLLSAPGYIDSEGRLKVEVPGGGKSISVTLNAIRSAMVTGRALDPMGRPVPGAEIGVATTSQIRQPEEITTDAEGFFKISNLMPGVAHMIAVNDDGIGGMLGPRMILKSGQTVEKLEFKINPSLKVRGRVVSDAGEPVVDAKVIFYTYFSDPNLYIANDVLRRSTGTDANGEFIVEGLARNCDFRIYCVAPGYVPQTPPVKSRTPLPEGHIVSVKETDIDSLRITLAKAGELRGRITDTDGKAQPGVKVYANMQKPSLGAGAESDENGMFFIDSLPPGDCIVRFAVPGSMTYEKRNVIVGGPPLEVALPLKPEIRGKVLDAATGEPIKDFTVGIVIPAQVRGGLAEAYESAPQRFQTEDGSFILRGLKQVTAKVRIAASGFAPTTISNVKGYSLEAIEVKMSRGAELTGRILDSRTGKPVKDADIHLGTLPPLQAGSRALELVPPVTTNEEGSFHIPDCPREKAILYVTHPEYAIAWDVIMPGKDGAFSPAMISLNKGISLSGSILNPKGRASAGEEVLMVGRGGYVKYSAKSDAKGRFEFDNIAGDTWYLYAGTMTAVSQRRIYSLDLRKLDRMTLVIGGKEGMELNGRIAYPRKAPPDVQVSLAQQKPFDGVLSLTTITLADRKGAFTLNGLPKAPGKLMIVEGTARAVHDWDPKKTDGMPQTYPPPIPASKSKR